MQQSIWNLDPVSSNILSDIWNTILDYRGYVIKNVFDNKHMQIAGLPSDIKMILDKKQYK